MRRWKDIIAQRLISDGIGDVDMKYSEKYRALRMISEIQEYKRDWNELDLIDKNTRKPMDHSTLGCYRNAIKLEEKETVPFCTTEGERNYIAQMLRMPEAKVFLDDGMWEALKSYDGKPDIELAGVKNRKALKPYGGKPDIELAGVKNIKKFKEKEIDNMKLVRRIMDHKKDVDVLNKSDKPLKVDALVDRCLNCCFYYHYKTRDRKTFEGIGFPIGIQVDVLSHNWYLDVYSVWPQDKNRKPDRFHARVSRFEQLALYEDDKTHEEMYEGLRRFLEEYLKSKGNADQIKTAKKLIESIVYGDKGNMVTEDGERPYKVLVYVRNMFGAPDRAAAAFSRYKREISLEETEIFTGEKEEVLCFRIYYFEWERDDILRTVISLGKFAYVRKLTESDYRGKLEEIEKEKNPEETEAYKKQRDLAIKESEEFVSRLMGVIARGVQAYS